MKKKLLHFTNHLGKPSAVRAEDVLYIQENRELEFPEIHHFTEIVTYNGSNLRSKDSAEELIAELSDIIER